MTTAVALIDGPLGEFLKDRETPSSVTPSGQTTISDKTGRAESLCKLYEMTLNLVPVETGARSIKVEVAEKARKRKGSFYTPISLCRLAVEAALQPAVSQSDRLSEILKLRILDPAMGAGIFLLVAHEYLLQATEELAPNVKEIARLIAQNCIYGIDIDDVAVEVAKLVLWLAVGDYDLHPLTAFPNLRVGNSLVGVRKELTVAFPSAIWKRKDLAGSKQNKVETLKVDANSSGHSDCEHLDRWCAYWFMSREELQTVAEPTVISRYKQRLKFFHWNYEFPEVFASENPGFDAIIGNPPWEIEKPNSREFFGSFKKEYWNLGKQDAIKTQDELRRRFPQLEQEWLRIYRDHYSMVNWVKYAPLQFRYGSDSCDSNRQQTRSFQYQGRGDANLYKLFVEQSFYLAKNGGTIGLIVPSGIYADSGTRELRQLLLDKCDLTSIVGFDNSDGAFDIHRSSKYCIFIATRGGITQKTHASFMHTAAQLASTDASLRRFGGENENLNAEPNSYDRAVIERISPKWSVICEVENRRSLQLLEKIHGNGIRLGDCEFKNRRAGTCDMGNGARDDGVKLRYAREFDMTLDSKLFHSRERLEGQGAIQDIFGNWLVGKWQELGQWQVRSEAKGQGIVQSANGDKFIPIENISKVFVPLYEGRMIGQFDFNEKQWVSGKGRQAVWRPAESKKILGPQYLVEAEVYKERRAASFKTGFLAVGSPTNARTMISTCLSEVACGNSVPVFFGADVELQLILMSIFNSFVFDYALRRRMSGNNLNYFVLEECPLPKIENLNAERGQVLKTVARCAARVAFGGHRFSKQLASLGYRFVPDVIDRAMRIELRAAIDVLVAFLFDLECEEFHCILRGDSLTNRNQKGFWRVDKNLPQSQSLIQNVLTSNERLAELGPEKFCREIECVIETSNGEKNYCASASEYGVLLSSILAAG